MSAKLYRVSKPVALWQVVYADQGRRVRKHFRDKTEAETYLREINRKLRIEGSAGVAFDGLLRADALAARRHLDAQGQMGVSLLHLAQQFTEVVTVPGAAGRPIEKEVEEFLHEKTHIEGAARETRANLGVRIGLWLKLSGITTVGGISRESVEVLRSRPVAAQTRKNDMNAVSNFCSWLVDKRRLDVHPLKGLKRPKVKRGAPPVHSPEEVAKLLKAAQGYLGGKWLGSVAALYFTGARPSELLETRFTYGRNAVARIEGGKLDGRANRTVPLSAAAVAWLKKAGSPAQVPTLTREVRRPLCKLAGVAWKVDVPRHTYITHRLLLVESDAMVAREAGTSEEIIHRHYRNASVTKAQAQAWAALRP